MKPTVYIFRGAAASGKGTLVPVLAEQLPKPVALIEQDKLRWGFHLIGREIPDISEEEHRMAYENTRLLYEQYLKKGNYTIVLEGLFTWDDTESSLGNAKELLALAKQYGFEAKSLVLAAKKEVLWQRNIAREYSVPEAEFEELFKRVYETVDDSEILIDTSDSTPIQVLNALLKYVT
jgi:predicted kinase